MKKLILSLFTMVMITVSAFAQDRVITGVVTSSEDGQPIPGASVKVKGIANLGVTTDGNGKFTLTVPEKGKALEISYLGYANSTVSIASTTNVKVVLTSDSKSLDEVVITAGGIVRNKKEQGYASTKVSAETLNAGRATTVASGLTGKIAGLQINQVGSGVNPDFRIVFRGNRSLSGNNQALIVIDNVISTSEVFATLNPEDIEDITALNSSSGAALYGSQASNGALLVTTKKGKKGSAPTIKIANTYALEQVSFNPKMQNKFGAGTAPNTGNNQLYEPYENQSFGPAFDGSDRNVGRVFADGTYQVLKYSAVDDKFKFWETGKSNQTDFSISSGDENSTMFLSGQYLDGTGITPKDTYNRLTTRMSGTRKFTDKFSTSYSLSYVENKRDVLSVGFGTGNNTNSSNSGVSTLYQYILGTPANIPLLSYKNWETDIYANPNGYFNDYDGNPYWLIDNSRAKIANNLFAGSIEFKYKVIKDLDLTYRAGINKFTLTGKSRERGFTYTDYAKTISGGNRKDLASSIAEFETTTGQFVTDFIANYKKDIKDFSINLIGGANLKTFNSKTVSANGTALQIDELYNLSNITGKPDATERNTLTRDGGVYLDATFGFKKYLYLHLTARNDWDSRLEKQNRSVFYPAADMSFVATDAFPVLKTKEYLTYLKLRASYSKVGLVNLDPYQTSPVFNSVTGFTSGTFYSQSANLVSNDLRPEITTGIEFGADFRLYKDIVEGSFTYYKSKSVDQVISTSVSNSTGFTNFLTNAGRLDNEGKEVKLSVNAIKTKNWGLTIGGNYANNENILVELLPTVKKAAVNGSSLVFGEEGKLFPQIIGTDYERDSQGRVIVDRLTGNPKQAAAAVNFGNTAPKHILGLNLEARWKDFTISSLFEYRGGYVHYNSSSFTFDRTGSTARSAYYNRERFVMPNSSYLDPVSGEYKENTNITVSDGGAGFWATSALVGVNSNGVYSGSYWKWRELSFSYNLPSKLLKKMGVIKSAKFSAQGRNLLLWTPASNEFSDPDFSANGTNNALGVVNTTITPPSRYFGGTISLTF
ncbi:MAG: SusC/RagA family TonB-linked outer membrane protein [Sphingobacteriaceae bacterium]|nr:SusC/RagA family TonB-linked outer membrane protein [Sphingobacteriaceae bacterium]